MRKKFLEKKLARLEAKKSTLRERGLSSEDVNEVRSIQAQLEELNEEISEVREELEAIKADEAREAAPVNGTIVASYGTAAAQPTEKRSENPYESMEYRCAFMRYAQSGTPIPAEISRKIAEYISNLPEEQRAGVPITTTDTAPAIPLIIMRDVINTVRKRYGNLYNKATKMSVAGGVEFPIGALQATFRWVNESTVSPRQKLDKLGKVSFGYHTAEIRIAQSFVSQLLTIEAFEQKIVEVIAIAYAQAMDSGMVKGTGDGQMLGIINDPRVAATGNVVTMTAAQLNSWSAWRKNFFAKIPLGYRAGEFIFPLSTVETYLETMADANNNPIFRQATGLEVNDGDAMNPNGRFFGREISLVEPDILPDFDTASSGDVIGIFWQPEEYAINENFAFTMLRYFDEETNEWVDKAIAVVDGKVLNPNGIWLIKKA